MSSIKKLVSVFMLKSFSFKKNFRIFLLFEFAQSNLLVTSPQTPHLLIQLIMVLLSDSLQLASHSHCRIVLVLVDVEGVLEAVGVVQQLLSLLPALADCVLCLQAFGIVQRLVEGGGDLHRIELVEVDGVGR